MHARLNLALHLLIQSHTSQPVGAVANDTPAQPRLGTIHRGVYVHKHQLWLATAWNGFGESESNRAGYKSFRRKRTCGPLTFAKTKTQTMS